MKKQIKKPKLVKVLRVDIKSTKNKVGRPKKEVYTPSRDERFEELLHFLDSIESLVIHLRHDVLPYFIEELNPKRVKRNKK